MNSVVIFVHVLLCCLAIGFGWLTLLGVLRNRLSVPRMIWFMRCSLGQNVAALFLSLHQPMPGQKVAMLSVYAGGLVILAWRAFHLTGAWRPTFAFALAVTLYLNILALSIQMPAVSAETGFIFQAALFTAALSIGLLAARRFTERTAALPLVGHGAPGTAAPHR